MNTLENHPETNIEIIHKNVTLGDNDYKVGFL